MADSLTFTIEPDETGAVSLGLFIRSVGVVHKLVQAVDYAVTHDASRWIVSGLHSSDPAITITPPPGRNESVAAITSGLAIMRRDDVYEPPRYFTDDALTGLQSFQPLFTGRTERIRSIRFVNGAGPVVVDRGIEQSVQRVFRAGYKALGSLDGVIEQINWRSRYFTIWERISGLPIRCWFPDEESWHEKVREHGRKRVLVQGLIDYFRNGVPRRVHAQDLAARDDLSVQKAHFGCIPDLTGNLDSADYLHRLREGTLGQT